MMHDGMGQEDGFGGEDAGILQTLVALESRVQYDLPPPPGQPPFAVDLGRLPVLLSAPHGASHWRQGRYKHQDGYTVAIARWVARQTGASALYAWARMDSDPNWDPIEPYKQHLQQLVRRRNIRFVIDLHGMSNRNRVGLALGAIRGASCGPFLPLWERVLQTHGFTPVSVAHLRADGPFHEQSYVVDHPRFTGGTHQATVTRFVHRRLGVPALQIEIASRLRVVHSLDEDPRRGRYRGRGAAICRTVRALAAAVQALADATAGPGATGTIPS